MSRSRALRAALLVAALATVVLGGSAVARGPVSAAPVVAAASDLQFALREVAEAFRAATGLSVRLSFGSSGNFARQIRQGAPFELYLSADERYVLELARDGFLRDAGVLYALGRIAIIAPDDSPLEPDAALDDLAAGLTDGRVTRFAIANPEHAPYGQRAREALRSRGLWRQLEPRLVLGENVSQAAQFAVSGNAQGGIIAWSLALAPAISKRGRSALIPQAWHEPLRQRMALARRAGPAAERFFAFLQDGPARAILRRHGFALPGDSN